MKNLILIIIFIMFIFSCQKDESYNSYKNDLNKYFNTNRIQYIYDNKSDMCYMALMGYNGDIISLNYIPCSYKVKELINKE
jgi:hypothetical protein